jgi:predicted RNA-binding protein (virulence factor B family)
VGEFATLEVVSVNRNIGAFLNWGLLKDLLLPFREQADQVFGSATKSSPTSCWMKKRTASSPPHG